MSAITESALLNEVRELITPLANTASILGFRATQARGTKVRNQLRGAAEHTEKACQLLNDAINSARMPTGKEKKIASIALLSKRLLRAGYSLKHGAPGWFVDGACGYLVAGYGERDAVIREAVAKICSAQDKDHWPAWRTCYTVSKWQP